MARYAGLLWPWSFLLSPTSNESHALNTILDHASPWLNGKVQEPSLIWWSQNLNPLIEDSCRKGRRWPGVPAYYSQELLVESNFRREPRAQYELDHASPWLNGKVQEPSFHMVVLEFESTNRGQLVGKGEDGQVCRPIIARSFLLSPTSNKSHALNTNWIMPRLGSMET